MHKTSWDEFQSTLSMRRATMRYGTLTLSTLFQSTLSMRRATAKPVLNAVEILISIHALHEESDTASSRRTTWWPEFQSTLSMRRATRQHKQDDADECISIHALHEESDARTRHPPRQNRLISIHALHEESDSDNVHFGARESFQSTLSMRRATGP